MSKIHFIIPTVDNYVGVKDLDTNIQYYKEHTKNKTKGNLEKHQKGNAKRLVR